MSTWTTPSTWTAASTVTASQMNTEIRDHLNWIRSALTTQLNITTDTAKAKITPALVGCRVKKAALQTITTGTDTQINFDTEDFDSDAFHDNVTNNTRITIPASYGGYYMIGCSIEWAASSAGLRRINIRVNGANSIVQSRWTPTSGGTTNDAISMLYQFAAADYAETQVAQTSGGNLDVTATTDLSPIFWIHRMSST